MTPGFQRRPPGLAMAVAWGLALAGCSTQPPPPDWQINAHGALERAVQAHLNGLDRVEAVELARARAEVRRTARADLMARVELAHCAVRQAALDAAALQTDCAAFAPLAADAGEPERAYQRYLRGQPQPADVALLPEAHRAMAQGWMLSPRAEDPAPALAQVADPVARLVAAGALWRGGQASPAVVALAVQTASDQGWRRPLMAWLGVQAALAERAGDTSLAEQARRRLGWVSGQPR